MISIDNCSLWDQFRDGSEEAYTIIMENYSKQMYNYGCRFSQNADFILDCIQEVFLELWKKRSKINATNSVKWYLFKSLRLRIFRDQSQWAISSKIDNEYSFHAEFCIESKLIEELNIQEKANKVIGIINQLPNRQREIIYLRFYEDMSYDQIAALMEINKQSVYNLLQKAFKFFRTEWAGISILTLLSLK